MLDSITFENAEKFALKHIEKYGEMVERMYSGLLTTNPEAFRLYNPKDIAIILVKVNPDYFNTKEFYLLLCYEKGANLSFTYKDLTDLRFYNYNDQLYFNKNEIDILLEESPEMKKKDVIKSLDIEHSFIDMVIKNESTPYYQKIVTLWLREDVEKYHKHINEPIGYYAKNAARYAYSELDLQPILDKVNDPDFSYQLDQAIASYDNSLYLASCATLGVCLETCCKLLLVRNNVKMKDSEPTMLDKLGEKLKENSIINYKFKGRIDVCYKVRNLASHTSPGKIVRSDCHFILNTIHELVETYF